MRKNPNPDLGKIAGRVSDAFVKKSGHMEPRFSENLTYRKNNI